jgi:hypothetical protein
VEHTRAFGAFTRVAAVTCAVMLAHGDSLFLAQQLPAPAAAPLPVLPPPGQALMPQQLDDLVAPIALYPDPLLGQILVASTYPLEVVQAYQWLQRNPGLAGPALTQAVQQQNWDASVQALVLVPTVVKQLNDDVTWTTNLGNAFLAGQAQVMDAVQRMRMRAQQLGKLTSTPQQQVVMSNDAGQPALEIEPADPSVIYVPVYDPAWIWGPPLFYPYPLWYWPPRPPAGFFIGFGAGISIGAFFGPGWIGWGGWGWHPGWGTHSIIINNSFIHRYNFTPGRIAGFAGTTAWEHDPAHRQGVPYANAALADRYHASVRQNLVAPHIAGDERPGASGDRVGNRSVPSSASPNRNRSPFAGMENGGAAARFHSDHGFSSLGPARAMPGGAIGGGRRR